MNQTFEERELTLIGAAEVSVFRDLRLRGLREHPEAFGEAAETFERRTLRELIDRIESQTALGGFILGAFSATGEMVGTIGLAVNENPKFRHRGTLWGMYIAPEAREKGLGVTLVRGLLDRAQSLGFLTQIHLAVVTSNTPAIRLYTKVGFTTYGVDPKAICVGGEFFDEYLMVSSLRLGA